MASATSTAPPPIPTRRRRRSSALVVTDLLDAALVEFAAHGFEGASTRAIAERAGAHQPQINYFFSSKEELWKASVDRLFGLLADAVDLPQSVDEDPLGGFTDAIRRFVRFSAERPELHRIMNLEATSDSDRLRWIVDAHVRPRFELVTVGWEAVRAAGLGTDLTGAQAFELIIGFGALPYANAPLLERLGAEASAEPALVEAHADRLVELLLGGPERDRSRGER